MNPKFNEDLEDFDKLCDNISSSDLTLEARAEFARLKKQADYLRSDAYRLRLEVWSSIAATVMAVAIIFGVNYAMASAGMIPAKTHKALYGSLSLVALHLLWSLWKAWRETANQRTLD